MKFSGAAKAAQDAADNQQRVATAAQAAELRQGIGWARAELSRLAMTPGFGSKTVTVVGGKGGSSKTTAAAMLGHYLSAAVRMLTVCVDFNPNLATLVYRFTDQPDRSVGSLVALSKALEEVHYPTELDAFLQPAAGRVHVLHNDFEDASAVAGLGRSELDAVRARLSQLAQLVIIDTGNSLTDQFFTAAVTGTDHLVLALEGDADALRTARKGYDELVKLGHQQQLSTATVIIGVRYPDLDPASLGWAHQWWNDKCGAAFLVPYDPVLAGGGVIDWPGLAPETELAFLHACVHAGRMFTTPPAPAPAPRHYTEAAQ
jgi:MinD-like ATPase involved in chromosome partitioning or flagellar assembly